ncbi:MAG: hypothetical protein M3516_02785 [Actinomycetota bacterium]|nr:hypothetical protein [Actinomycetota bacterium]
MSLRLSRHLRATGTVGTTGLSQCTQRMPVRIQRKRANGTWAVVTDVMSRADGPFGMNINDRKGKYRAVALRTAANEGDICG